MEKSSINAPSPSPGAVESREDLHYWDIASKYWKDVVTVNPTWAWDSFYAHHIPDSALTILVLGVTNGAFLKLIKTFLPHAHIYAIDFSFEMITHVKSIEKKIICCRGNHLPFKDGQFDIILSDYFLSVLHRDVLESVLKEIHRCLGENGLFIAKELRHQGHMAAWILSLVLVGIAALVCGWFNPVASLPLVPIWVLMLLAYDPFHKKMGRTAAVIKFFIHYFKFILKRKHIPNRKESKELYFLSKKYLNIFSDSTLHYFLKSASLHNTVNSTLLSWNFSLVCGKRYPQKR